MNITLESANSAYNAAEAADAVGDKAGAAGYMNVAQKAADRAVSFGEHNRPLLPVSLQAQASPLKALRLQIKGMVADLPVVVHHQKKVMMECDIKRASVLFLTDYYLQ